MLGNPGFYANKKRKKPVLKQKRPCESNEVVKSNPSKRHRDRLNGELDRLTDLLPFPDETRSRLDKLSVLRLSVGYLRVKSYFKATMKNTGLLFSGVNGENGNHMDTASFSEGDLLLQALNGFVIVVTSEGLVFYVSPTIKDYLGFHQSDVVHQSVFELIHTDDRATFRQQLHFALNPPAADVGEDGLESFGNTVMYSPEKLPPENSSFLERSFVCRFRCLLDNSSGFLALKFQGRLKYLHGQKILRDNGACHKPQLALFAIAMPVQPPSIVEIRAKMLFFQTKHKLDFTPLGIDSRGKVILGYSETELCMKGSGYQFIHAADMMYCADNHTRMMKTGESGLTVFRLLSKSGGWLWVKANAKVVYKDGRPDFIISYQKALVNTEGEEYLRQRRLPLPFSFTTGEAVLYDNGPTVDITQFQFNKMFNKSDRHKDVTPGSLLDSFLKQDKTAYSQTVDPPLPVDEVFKESHALVSVGSDEWQDHGARATTCDPVVMKTNAKQSVMTMIDSLEEMAQNGDLCSVLENLDPADTSLLELENALKQLSQNVDQQNVSSELDSILTNDVFDYIDTVLFKETGEDCLNSGPPSCLTAINNNHQDHFIQAAQLSAAGLCEQPLFQTPSPEPAFPPVNGIYSNQQAAMNGHVITGQDLIESAHLYSRTQKLSHHAPLITQADPNPAPPQPLQLQDIFSPSIELPALTVPGASADDASASFPSCRHAAKSQTSPQGTPGQTQPSQLTLFPQNSLQAKNLAPNVLDILPPLIPCNDLNSSNTPNIPVPFTTACLQGSPPLETHNHQIQQWPQSQQQKLPHAGILQNGHELLPAGHSQTSESQTFPHAGLWPRSVVGQNQTQQGGLACGQEAAHSSCMFDQHFSASAAGNGILALSGCSSLKGTNRSLDLSPPPGSCYFQWNHSEPVVGTSAINQENTIISPLTAAPSMSAPEHAFNMQQYLENHTETQVNLSHCGLNNFTQQ